jgi:hypothetical protein
MAGCTNTNGYGKTAVQQKSDRLDYWVQTLNDEKQNPNNPNRPIFKN